MMPIDSSLTFASQYGLVGAAIIANVFPAIPEEVFLLAFGYLANTRPELFPFFRTVGFLMIGFLMIDSAIYYLAGRGSNLIFFLTKKVLGIDLVEKKEFLKQHTAKIIFLSRFLVHLRIIGPTTAGMINYPYRKFIMVDFLALCVYVPLVIGIGYYFSDRVESILTGANVVRNIMSVVIGVTLVFILTRKLRLFIVKFMNSSAAKEIRQ